MNKKETLLNTTVTFLGRTSRSSRPKGKQLLCEMQNSDGSVEFIFDGTVFYVHSMAVVYMENKKHSMQVTLWFKQAWKETFCIHDYTVKGVYKTLDSHGYLKCKKCGRIK